MIKIEINAADLAKLSDMAGKLDDTGEPLGEFAAYVLDRTHEGFRRQEDPDGKTWKDLKPATWKRKKTKSILRESGRLEDSIKLTPGKSSVTIVSPTPYSAPVQEERLFLGVSDKDLEKGRQIAESYVRRITNG